MAVADVKDPKVREEYAAHLEKSRQTAENNKQQRKLRQLREQYAPPVEDYVAAIYSMPPYDREELGELLGRIADSDMRARILRVVIEKETASED